MEDAHSVQLNYAGDPDSSYFAVFDGHGGAKFAEYCSTHLHLHLHNDPAFSKMVHETKTPFLKKILHTSN